MHPTDNSIGLSHRLLVSRKDNVLGIGKKQHGTSDQWWMNAFDQSLKCMGVEDNGKRVQVAKSGALELASKGSAGWKWLGQGGGLYGCFVKGEVLGGTLDAPVEATEPGSNRKKRRIRSEDKDKPAKRIKSSEDVKRQQKRAEKQARKEAKATLLTPPESDAIDNNMEAKRVRKEERRKKRAAKEAAAANGEDEVIATCTEIKKPAKSRGGSPDMDSKGTSQEVISKPLEKERSRKRKKADRSDSDADKVTVSVEDDTEMQEAPRQDTQPCSDSKTTRDSSREVKIHKSKKKKRHVE